MPAVTDTDGINLYPDTMMSSVKHGWRDHSILRKLLLYRWRYTTLIVVLALGVISGLFLSGLYYINHRLTVHRYPMMTLCADLELQLNRCHMLLHEHALNSDERIAFRVRESMSEASDLSNQIVKMAVDDPHFWTDGHHERYITSARKIHGRLIRLDAFVTGTILVSGWAEDQKSYMDKMHATIADLHQAITRLKIDVTKDARREDRAFSRLFWPILFSWSAIFAVAFISTRMVERRRRLALQAVSKAEAEVRTFIESADDMIYFRAVDGSITFLNQVLFDITGYTVEEFAGNRDLIRELMHPTDVRQAREFFEHHSEGSSSYEMEYRLRGRDGQWHWILSRMVGVVDESSRHLGYNCIDRDITPLKMAERDLADRERRYHDLVETSEDMICSVDRTGKFLFVNRAVRRTMGYTVTEVMGERLTIFVKPAEHQRLVDLFKTVLSGKYLRGAQMTFMHKNGSPVRMSINAIPVRDSEGRIVAITGTASDITLQKKAEEALERSELAYRTTIDAITDVIHVVDPTLKIVLANKELGQWCRVLGLETNIVGKTVFDVFPFLPEKVRDEYSRVFATGESITTEETTEFEGGSLVTETRKIPIMEAGQVIRVVTAMQDITNRKRAERELNELATFPEYNPNLVISLSAEGQVAYVNRSARRFLHEQGLVEADITQLFPISGAEIVRDFLERGSGKREYVTTKYGRSWLWCFHGVRTQKIVHGYATDITDTIQRDKEIRRLSAALNQSSNMICITDPDAIIQYVNPYFCRVTGYAEQEVIGRSVNILRSGMTEPETYVEMWKEIEAGRTWAGVIKNRKKGSELYWERKTISPVFNEQDEIINYLAVGEDITNELKTQAKFIESDKLSAIGTLAAGVAHEFKNYLGGIIGNASFTLSELDSENGLQQARETLNRIIEMGERANDVAMSLLTYSKSEPDHCSCEDIETLIERSTRLIIKELLHRSIELVTHYEKSVQVEISASKFQQMILNLLINAQHAIGSNGVITIALFDRGDIAELRVADTGGGISPENIKRIFDPFFSTKGVWGRDEVAGSGMGLAICRNIAREYGGDLTVDSIVGMGTCFTATLPVSSESGDCFPQRTIGTQELRALFLTLDKSLLSHYHEQACRLNVRLMVADRIDNVKTALKAFANLAILDARFPAKLELYRTVEYCRQADIPCLIIMGDNEEYQLSDLYSRAQGSFKGLPDFTRLLEAVGSIDETARRREESAPQ